MLSELGMKVNQMVESPGGEESFKKEWKKTNTREGKHPDHRETEDDQDAKLCLPEA